MKKKHLYLIIGALFMVNIFTWLKLNTLENYIDNNIQQSHIIENNLRNEISNIYSNIDEKLKKQASIIDSYNVEFGSDLNTDNLTIPITVTITPKEYSEGLTSSLQINDKTVEMERKETTFLVRTDVSVFDNIELKIVLNQNGVQKTETIEEVYDLKGKYLLEMFDGRFSGSTSYSSGKYKYNGNINIDFNQFQEGNPKKITIIKELNGKIIDEQNIDLKIEKLEYGRSPIEVPINEVLDVGNGVKFIVYAEIVDKYDLTYKYNIINDEINSEGEQASSASFNQWPNGLIEIRDKNGKVVYKPSY